MVALAIAFCLLAAPTSPVTMIAGADDLGPAAKRALREAVGDRRVVMLGELTHGDGTAFRLKTSVVKYLHEEMGFDVLAWESGLYDCAEMEKEMAGDNPLRQVAAMGVFNHWSAGAESFPVFEYARATHKTKRPLTMAGFDIQGSGSASNSLFPDMLDWFKDRPELTAEDRKAVADAFTRVRESGKAADPQKAFAEAYTAVYAAAARFQRASAADPAALAKAWGDQYLLRLRVIQNAAEYADMRALNKPGEPIFDSYNLRERANANNLLWLMRERFKGKKIVVWAHNSHIFRGLPGRVAGTSDEPEPDEIDSMGRIISYSIRGESYVLGVMAREGKWSWLGNGEIAYQDPGPESIEEQFHKAGHPLAFADFSRLPQDHPWRKPLPGYVDQQNPFKASMVWPDGYDGVLYVDKMEPRHNLPPAQ